MAFVIADDFFLEITDVEENRILSPKIIDCLRTKGIECRRTKGVHAYSGVFSTAHKERGEYRVKGKSLEIYGYDSKSAGLFYAAIVQCANIIAEDEGAAGDEAAEDPVSEHLGMPSPGGSMRKKPNAEGGRRKKSGRRTRRR